MQGRRDALVRRLQVGLHVGAEVARARDDLLPDAKPRRFEPT